MRSKIRWSWKHKDFISSNWVKSGEKGNCPKCSLPLTAIVETKECTVYYHAKTIRCMVQK
jgi:hypothetical protein